jgi:FMN reductase
MAQSLNHTITKWSRVKKQDNVEPAIRVVGICGSLRPASITRQALAVALAGARAAGAQTQLIDLGDYHLEFCCPGEGGQYEYSEGVQRLRAEVKQAHGIILATPEYHASYSGVLKNALDLMGFEEFEGKMVGLIGVSGGMSGAVNALTALQMVGRALHAWVIPEQGAVPQASKSFDENGRPRDPNVEKRLREVGRQVARFAYLHTSEQALEFMRLWESALQNPGGIDR